MCRARGESASRSLHDSRAPREAHTLLVANAGQETSSPLVPTRFWMGRGRAAGGARESGPPLLRARANAASLRRDEEKFPWGEEVRWLCVALRRGGGNFPTHSGFSTTLFSPHGVRVDVATPSICRGVVPRKDGIRIARGEGTMRSFLNCAVVVAVVPPVVLAVAPPDAPPVVVAVGADVAGCIYQR